MPQFKKYTMTDAQYAKLLEACKPVPYMVFGGREPLSPQDRANLAWQALGEELGFIWDTVRPVGPNEKEFEAVEKTDA
jgi:hypothetical protein